MFLIDSPRFPWIVPSFTKPEYVAKKAIEGIRRNKVNVCIPASVVLFGFFLKYVFEITVENSGLFQ